MKFIEFKNYLINNDILMFDYDYRICYQNIFLLNDEIYKNNQVGGGKVGIYISPFTLIKRIDTEKNEQKRLHLLIDKLKENNLLGAKFLCQNFINLKFD